MKKIVIMPGGFHPFHAGHYALYQSAKKAFPDADMYVAASDSRTERPFPFQIKQKLAQVAGVKPNEFVQVKSPFRSEEITAKYNPEEDVLIFVRSEKDKTEQPIPGGTKKDGTPAYFQRYNPKDMKPFKQHGYIAYLPTVEFAGGIKSATEIRKQWPHLNTRQKQQMVQALYPNTTGNKKLIDNVVQMINAGMGELTEGDLVSFKRPQLQSVPKELVDAVSQWWQVKDTGDGKYMKAFLAQRGIDVEHKGDIIDDYVMVKWRDGGYRKKGIIKVDDIMEKLIQRAYQNPPDDEGPFVAEAYDPYDEADVLLRYDPADKKLKKRSWVHAKLDQARREGWRYTAEEAMRVHGYFPSKYKQGEFIKKGIDGKWEKVFPYAQRTDERNIWDKIEEDYYWNVGDGQNEPAAGTQPSEELRLKKSHQYAGAFVGESVDKIRKMIKETSDDEKEKTAHLHRKFFEMMEGEVINVDFREPEANKQQIQQKYNQRKQYLFKLEEVLMGIHEELAEMEQLGLLPLHMLDFYYDCKKMIKYIQNFKDEDDPLPDDEGNFLESIINRAKFMREAWLNRKSHTFEAFRNDPILASMPGGDVDTSGPKVLRPQELKTKRVGPQPAKFWKVTKKQDYLPEK
jgi:glycerol-3-phosphate cytidylyltransferase-like family protein